MSTFKLSPTHTIEVLDSELGWVQRNVVLVEKGWLDVESKAVYYHWLGSDALRNLKNL